jgi:hypothetical protein
VSSETLLLNYGTSATGEQQQKRRRRGEEEARSTRLQCFKSSDGGAWCDEAEPEETPEEKKAEAASAP